MYSFVARIISAQTVLHDLLESNSMQESNVLLDNVKRAQTLRLKASQLAQVEQDLMDHACRLNLLAKQLAEATMKPNQGWLNQASSSSLPYIVCMPFGE